MPDSSVDPRPGDEAVRAVARALDERFEWPEIGYHDWLLVASTALASLRGPVEAGTDEPSSGDAISVEGQLGAERLTSDTDGCKELVQLAAWWASEMAGNEVRVEGFTLPPAFREMVARWMVEDPDLGWPDLESAHVELEELYPNA
jgi:hypothetical protein